MFQQPLRWGARRFSSQPSGSRSLFKWATGLTLTLSSVYIGTTYAAIHNKSIETLYRDFVPNPQTHIDIVSDLEKNLSKIQWETLIEDSATAIGASVAGIQHSITDQLNQLGTLADSYSKDLTQQLSSVSQSVDSVIKEFEQWKGSIDSWSKESLTVLKEQAEKIQNFFKQVELWISQFINVRENNRLEPMNNEKIKESAQTIIQELKQELVKETQLVQEDEKLIVKEEKVQEDIPFEEKVIVEEKITEKIVNEENIPVEEKIVEDKIVEEKIPLDEKITEDKIPLDENITEEKNIHQKESEKEHFPTERPDALKEENIREEKIKETLDNNSVSVETSPVEKEPEIKKEDTPLPIQKSRQEVANELALLLTGIAAKVHDSSLSNPLNELANIIPNVMNADYTTEADFQQIHGHIVNIVKGVESLLSNQKLQFDYELKKQTQEFTILLGDYVVQYEMELEALKKNLEKQQEERLLAQKEELEASHVADLTFELQKQAKEYDMIVKEQLFEQEQALQEFWKKESKKMIDQERSGRLARLDHLAYQVKVLEMVLKEYCGHVETSVNVQRLSLACQSLKEKLGQQSKMVNVTAEVELLRKAGHGIELIESVLDTVKPGKVSSLGRLQRQFDELSEALRRTQLMPDNGGPLSYYLSLLFSNLLFIPIGYVRGDDTGSILARVRHFLQEKDLDSAARELNQIKGRWMRLIVKDWLNDARAHLELNQAIELIESYSRLMSMNQV